MKKGAFFVVGILAAALTFGIILAGCDNWFNPDPDPNPNPNPNSNPSDYGGGGGDTFVAVTNITGVPTVAVKGVPLLLTGTAVPSNATNRTIVWSGAGVSDGALTATSAGSCTVTATIVNGASKSSPYTKAFTITVYDAGSGGANPFGANETPYIWAMDNTGGSVYVTVTDTSWAATADGAPYNTGTYARIEGTEKAARWTVSEGTETGTTGLGIILENGTLLVANFVNEYSDMNGRFTKLDTDLTLEGTWETSERVSGKYARMVVSSGEFVEYLSDNGSDWEEIVRGTYSGTNPAACTFTEVNLRVYGGKVDTWKSWNELTSNQKKDFGGSETFTAIIYTNRIEVMGKFVLQKQ
ncbi:MAG: hypothetical protein LBP76_00650 [Treponema sp.]|jgi:hypothetical protein|nr:hypothetical protein [Treponema sp.]